MNEQLILNRYRLDERLASGGSAEVWRAHDVQFDRVVAVKRLHPHLLPDAASRERLVAEARAAAGLSHPAIVGVYDVDAIGESAAIVMELVDGESLAARIERAGALPATDVARITADVAEALFHAHQRGVVHRDVKPGNVLLASDGRTRLVDFGIAHSLAASAERLTQTGTVVGTLRSMAPEQLAGGPITPRTDLYGLGTVLHEALTGRPVHPASTAVALADAQRDGPPDLHGIDPGLAAVVVACLAYDPADRPLHAGALAGALRAWLAGDPSPATALAPSLAAEPAADADRAAVTQVVPVPPPVGDTAIAPERPIRRRSAWPMAALIAAAIGLVVAAAVFFGPNPLGGAISATPTPSPTASPSTAATAVAISAPAATPSPNPPGWLPNLLERLADQCGPEVAEAEEANIAAMERRDAREYVDELVRGCSDEGEGEGD